MTRSGKETESVSKEAADFIARCKTVQQIEEGRYTTKKAASNRVRFTGSIREVICKVAALTDAPRAIGDADEWEEWHKEQYESRGRHDPDTPYDAPDTGYSDDDFWADKFHLVQCWDKEGTLLRFEIVPDDISLRGAPERFAGQFIDKTRHKN